MSLVLLLLGGGGLVTLLGGLAALFVRGGRILAGLEWLDARMTRQETRLDSLINGHSIPTPPVRRR